MSDNESPEQKSEKSVKKIYFPFREGTREWNVWGEYEGLEEGPTPFTVESLLRITIEKEGSTIGFNGGGETKKKR
jgi:hypothetical protein